MVLIGFYWPFDPVVKPPPSHLKYFPYLFLPGGYGSWERWTVLEASGGGVRLCLENTPAGVLAFQGRPLEGETWIRAVANTAAPSISIWDVEVLGG